MPSKTLTILLPVGLFHLAPSLLSHTGQARHQEELQIAEVVHRLTPDSCLDARHLLCRLLDRRVKGHRIPIIHLGNSLFVVGHHAQSGLLRCLRAVSTLLRIRRVHIDIAARRENHLRPLTDTQLGILRSLLHEVGIELHQLAVRLRLVFHLLTRVDRIRIALFQENPMLEEIALANVGTSRLLPTNHSLASGLYQLTNRVDIAHELIVRQAYRLVTTNMQISTGSQGCHLFDHRLRQGHRLRIIHVEGVQRLSREIGINFQLHRISQFRIGRKDRLRVTWQIHLWDNRHLTFRRIAHQLFELLLCVVATWLTLVGNLSAHLGQLRIGLDLDAPSLIVGEVHVQHVHLIERDQVDHLLHLLHREETARDIQ